MKNTAFKRPLLTRFMFWYSTFFIIQIKEIKVAAIIIQIFYILPIQAFLVSTSSFTCRVKPTKIWQVFHTGLTLNLYLFIIRLQWMQLGHWIFNLSNTSNVLPRPVDWCIISGLMQPGQHRYLLVWSFLLVVILCSVLHNTVVGWIPRLLSQSAALIALYNKYNKSVIYLILTSKMCWKINFIQHLIKQANYYTCCRYMFTN